MTKLNICGAILSKEGTILFIDQNPSEDKAWQWHLGWPSEEDIAAAKDMGEHFALVEVREKEPKKSDALPPELEALMVKVRALPEMTEAQLRRQRKSFVRGQMGMVHPEMTRERIDEVLDQIDPEPTDADS